MGIKAVVNWAVIYATSLLPISALASTYQGQVANVYSVWGKVYIVVNNDFFNGAPSACAPASGMVFAINASSTATNLDKFMMATILSAKVTGKTVYANGDGVCTTGNPFNGGGSEALVGVDLKD